ncbi:phage tail-collar fiber domain-containing protein [Pseudomonas grimontii]|uniref:phage tail-collar fiber domain-containing protein n=1 Tax=Pseudomonas grimontii TaxID=129847 RepID=UPI0028E6C881|nr:phage tail protein [Pseudomonas grimontii]
MADYYTLLTNAGIAYETACKAAGVPIKLAQISIGDGNGAVYNPDASAKALKREVWRGPLNALFQDEKNANWLMAEVTIPSDVGGWYVREAGLWTDTGILYAVVKYPESYKPVLATSGSGKEFYIRSIFETSNASIVTLLIDDTVVKATRAWVMDYLAQQLAKGTYTKAEIEAMIAKASALPVGSMVAFPVEKIPPGFLEIDGSVKSVAAYPDLAKLLAGAFNKGDEAAGTFRLPESRGEFLRGWDHGRAVDTGRSIGSYQIDTIQNIVGNLAADPAAPYQFLGEGNLTATGAFGVTLRTAPGIGDATNVQMGASLSFDASRSVRTSTETRGRNLAVMWCIKAWNAPINQGSIDIAALVPLAAQATEINQGTAKIATQPLTDAGVDDTTIVTPKKIRFGFQFIKGGNGAIIFPTWLGGWIIQWGSTPEIPNATAATFNYTVPFPAAAICPGAFRRTQGNNSATVSTTLSQITINNRPHYTPDTSGTANQYYFFCFGY